MARNLMLGSVLSGPLIAAQPALAQADPEGYYGSHMWDGGSWMFLGPLWMIVFVAAIVVIAVLLFRWLGGTGHSAGHSQPPGRTPGDILRERFARGEIDKEEFEERRRLLE